MMKRWIAFLCALSMVFLLAACGNADKEATASPAVPTTVPTATPTTAPTAAHTAQQSEPQTDRQIRVQTAETEQEGEQMNVQIEAGGKAFTATMHDNETTRAFMERLPLTIDMGELNGNEKYYYFSDGLPTESTRPPQINNGDLMLYGADCLVLFYEDFSTSYSYTPLGVINDPSALKEALGNGNVQVTFSME